MLLSLLMAALAAETPMRPVEVADRVTVGSLGAAGVGVLVLAAGTEASVVALNEDVSAIPANTAMVAGLVDVGGASLVGAGAGLVEAGQLRRLGTDVPVWAGYTSLLLWGGAGTTAALLPDDVGWTLPLAIGGVSFGLLQAHQSHRAYLRLQIAEGELSLPSPYPGKDSFHLIGHQRMAKIGLGIAATGATAAIAGVVVLVYSSDPYYGEAPTIGGALLYSAGLIPMLAGNFLQIRDLRRAGVPVSSAPVWLATGSAAIALLSLGTAGDTGGASLLYLTAPFGVATLVLGGVQSAVVKKAWANAPEHHVPLASASEIQILPSLGWTGKAPVFGLTGTF